MNTSHSGKLGFPLKIAMTAMSEQTQSSVEHLLSLSNERFFRVAAGDDIPDVIVIDHDHPGTATRLSKSNWQQNIPLLILTTGDIVIAGAIMVCKPIDESRLEKAAHEAHAQLIRHKQLEKTPEIKPQQQTRQDESTIVENLERVRAKVELMCGPVRTLEQLNNPIDTNHRFDPLKTVSGRIALLLSDEKSRYKAVQVQLPDDEILIFPTLDKVFTSTSLDIRDNVTRVFQDLDETQITVLKHKSKAANEIIDSINRKSTVGFSIDAFLWLSTLFAARGRLPLGFDIHAPMYLNQWPDLSRLELTPNCMEITAALANSPASLTQLIDQLGCEPRHVASFVNAAYAIGILSLS